MYVLLTTMGDKYEYYQKSQLEDISLKTKKAIRFSETYEQITLQPTNASNVVTAINIPYHRYISDGGKQFLT